MQSHQTARPLVSSQEAGDEWWDARSYASSASISSLNSFQASALLAPLHKRACTCKHGPPLLAARACALGVGVWFGGVTPHLAGLAPCGLARMQAQSSRFPHLAGTPAGSTGPWPPGSAAGSGRWPGSAAGLGSVEEAPPAGGPEGPGSLFSPLEGLTAALAAEVVSAAPPATADAGAGAGGEVARGEGAGGAAAAPAGPAEHMAGPLFFQGEAEGGGSLVARLGRQLGVQPPPWVPNPPLRFIGARARLVP
jgi:hypothetical protein